MSDDRLTRLFEEYRELGHSWRADDARFSSQQVMLFPLSVGALIVSYIHTGIPNIDCNCRRGMLNTVLVADCGN